MWVALPHGIVSMPHLSQEDFAIQSNRSRSWPERGSSFSYSFFSGTCRRRKSRGRRRVRGNLAKAEGRDTPFRLPFGRPHAVGMVRARFGLPLDRPMPSACSDIFVKKGSALGGRAGMSRRCSSTSRPTLPKHTRLFFFINRNTPGYFCVMNRNTPGYFLLWTETHQVQSWALSLKTFFFILW